MPKLESAIIVRAWRYKSELGTKDRIHYAVRRVDGDVRHCFVDKGAALYAVLDEHLQAIGYAGPQSDDEH